MKLPLPQGGLINWKKKKGEDGVDNDEGEDGNRRQRSDEISDLWRWMGLVAAIWVQAFAGNAAAYANYSATLKSVLQLSQVQLNYLALSKDLGENMGLLAGLICNKVPPWIILSVAALEGFLGFGTLWLVASDTVRLRPPLWQMCIAIFVGGNSMTWFNTAVLVTCMRNFPKSRGTIVGFLKGFIGLSGAIFTQIFTSWLSSSGVNLLFFLSVGPTLVCLFCMGFIRPIMPQKGESYAELEEEKKHFSFIYIVCIALAIYLFVLVFINELVSSSLVSFVAAIVMFLFLMTPVAVPVRLFMRAFVFKSKAKAGIREALQINLIDDDNNNTEPLRSLEDKREGILGGDNGEVTLKVTESKMKVENAEEEGGQVLLALGEGAVKQKKKAPPRRGEDFKLTEALVKFDFWLIFFVFFCGVGTALTAGNNLSQLGEAQGYSQASTFVLLFGIWGFIGRLGGGAVSEHFIRSSNMPRSVWIGVALFLMIPAHLLFAFAIPGTLHFASSLMGLCFGIQIAAIVPTASEIFGLKHFGIIYNFITLADPIASFLFSTLLAGSLYDLEVLRQYGTMTDDGEQLVCTGAHCFRLTFFIAAGVCAIGTVGCVILTIRLKPVYVNLYGAQDWDISYTTLPSCMSYTSLPSVNTSSASLPGASSAFPRVLSSSSITHPKEDPQYH